MGIYEFWFGIARLVVATICVVSGAVLVYARRHGKGTWTIQCGSARLEISTTAPGTVLAVVGLLIVYVTAGA
jgi:hypothetical protein